ncbi:unnamed protein product [Cercopithifilaria johnstoni]|uniref:Ubiquitin-like domain-containing protein n=1 Tax=Cercopithifilaria johnstoni TaxID=2874296 RepID=A0A8J2LNK4_9BILA|nr:unnamed protein product [Cercopithifilaria johnstoni]
MIKIYATFHEIFLKEEKGAEKNAILPSDSQQVQTRSINTSLFANMKIVSDASSQKKNEKIAHQKASNGRNKSVLRALTSPGCRSPEISNTLICKTAQKSKSESHVSRADMVTVTIKSTVSSFKPLKLVMKKTTSIRMLKNYLHSRFSGANKIILIYDNKELKNEGGSLASVGITSGSVLWLLVKPVSGNNDREEIASLIRMSQSLANLRNLIRSLPSIDSSEPSLSGSGEYAEVVPCGYREAEHEQMREKMKLLIKRREKSRQNSAKDSPENSRLKIQEMPEKEVTTDSISQSPSSFNSSCASVSSTCKTSIALSPSISTPKGTADIMKQKELATYFDPPETIKQRKFEEEELFDVPSNESELLKIKDEIKNKRCSFCRIKLKIADREIKCICGHIFCSKHRNPQMHRCNIDLKSIDRVYVRMALPKLLQDIPKSKI